jgi:uncharacterized protein involved in exopolysaccharide biosynthesis
MRPRDDDDDEIDLRAALLAALARRRRLAVAAIVLTAGTAATIARRVLAPVCQGSSQLLVTDPISQDSFGRSADPDSLGQLAISQTCKVDTAVPSQVLRSTWLLQPVARRFDLPVGAIASQLTIGDAERKSLDVRNVTMQWSKPLQGEALLRALVERYLDCSLRQRQEKLRQDLAFPDEQAPEIQKRMAQVGKKLAEPEANFTDSAPQVRELRARHDQLRLLPPPRGAPACTEGEAATPAELDGHGRWIELRPQLGIVTNSSATVGCRAMVRSKSALVAPMPRATAAIWMISAA